jgi:predicted dehydrogenase
MQVDGTKGSAIVGLRDVWIQHYGNTPKPIWNPDIPQPIDFYNGWSKVPEQENFDNAFKVQWELFLRHVVLDEPFRWTLLEGAKGVQLAEYGIKSSDARQWIELPELKA